MPVDYFSGFNSGSDTLINALNDYRKIKEEAPAREMQRLMMAEKLEETKRRRASLADIKRIQELGEKPLSGTDPLASDFPTPAPQQMTSALSPILGEGAIAAPPEPMATPVGSPAQPTPARKYSQQEKNRMMLQSAVKYGDWETVQRLGNAIEMTDKLDKQDAAQLSWWATQVQQFRKVTNNPEAAKAYGQNLAAKMGIPPEQVAGIDFTPKADIIKPDGQGGQVMIMTDDAGKQHFMHIAPKDAAHNVQEIPSPDGKTAQKFQYNSETKRYDIPVGAPYKVKSQVQNINVQSGPQTSSDVETMARGILDGTIDPNGISKRGGLQGAVWARVKQLDPKFNIVQAGGNAKFATANQTQQTQTLLNSINPMFDALLQSGKKLNNTSIPLVNLGVNKAKEYAGNPDIVAFNNLRDDVVAELERGLMGTGVLSDSKYNRALKNLNSAQSPAQLQAAVGNIKTVIKARMHAINQGPYPGSKSPAKGPNQGVTKTPAQVGRFQVEVE